MITDDYHKKKKIIILTISNIYITHQDLGKKNYLWTIGPVTHRTYWTGLWFIGFPVYYTYLTHWTFGPEEQIA